MNQIAIVASQLKARNFTNSASVPLEIWLEIGFLQAPTKRLMAKIDALIGEAEVC